MNLFEADNEKKEDDTDDMIADFEKDIHKVYNKK